MRWFQAAVSWVGAVLESSAPVSLFLLIPQTQRLEGSREGGFKGGKVPREPEGSLGSLREQWGSREYKGTLGYLSPWNSPSHSKPCKEVVAALYQLGLCRQKPRLSTAISRRSTPRPYWRFLEVSEIRGTFLGSLLSGNPPLLS